MPLSDPQLRKSFYKITLYAIPTGPMDIGLNIKYDFDTRTNTGVVQPETQRIQSTGTSVFIYGS